MKRVSIILICIFASNFLLAQDHIIQGVVHTLDKIPLIGAKIQVKSSRRSVYTDSLGNFAVNCSPKDRLKIMARGFYTQNVRVTENIKLVAVNLKLRPGLRSQEYAIGYGYVTDRDRSSAVTGVNTSNPSYLKYSNMYDLIRGELPGVQVANGEIKIRGVSSLNSSSTPLIVVDGVISDYDVLDILSPIHVKRIDVIKDASSAVYGDRGANGVIIIETKKGGEELK